MKDFLTHYVNAQRSALESIPLEEVELLIGRFRNALQEDRQIFIFGNGGSAANASHFITDLGKGSSDKTYRRFRCLSLNDNTNWLTAIGNDYCYEDIFLRQLQNYARPGDLVIVMSVSGNSLNLVRALEWCRNNDIFSAALLGKNEGKLAQIANQIIRVDSTHFGRVEDCHMHICHMICYAFMEIEALQVS
ncbi:MAG TPA: SIS domain-containing protein [Pedobacter sp.]|nr:SIS domain-containing protein [Pedobacter sp.]